MIVIIAAVIAAVPMTLSAVLTYKSHTLLKGNGKGTVPVMLSQIIDGQARHEVDDMVRFAKMDSRLSSLEQK